MDAVQLPQYRTFQLSLSITLTISVILILIPSVVISGDIPDVCVGSSVDTIEKVEFLDSKERYFLSSGRYYWFINTTSDLPNSDNAQLLPHGFKPDAAIIIDTRQCRNGQYALLLIERRKIHDRYEAEWRTMTFDIGEWGENGTDSGSWNFPQRIVHCNIASPVCTTSNDYFATMNFDFKKPLNAAYGVIGGNAFFIQDSLIYNVTYKHPCIKNPYKDIVAKPPSLLVDSVTAAAAIDSDHILHFDGEYYIELSNDNSSTDMWYPASNNFFQICPQQTSTFASILSTLFQDGRTRTLSMTAFAIIIIIGIIIITGISGVICYVIFKKRRKRIITSDEHGDDGSNDGASPPNERHLLNNHDDNKDTTEESSNSQVRVPLQTSC